MSDWIYVGAVLFGAFSLLIEADRNYRTTLGNSPFPYHAILEKVELENLCTPREWMSGFLFYSLLYLLAYAVILSSTELFLLVRDANLAELEVGAHTDFVGPLSDPMELANSTFGKPIFVSAFLIAFLSVGAMKPVETYMRALAHRLAGVPRGVYKVLERLQTVEYLKLNAKYPSPLLQKFERLTKPATFRKVSDQYNEDIQTQLSAIDCLSPSVTAGFSRLHFPLTHFDAFKDVPKQLAREIEDVEDLIDNVQPNEASLKALHEKAVLAANSAKAVFAVFYVRNNHAIKNTDPKSTIAKIEKLIARGYRTELNSFAMSMFIGVLISLAVAFSTYHWRSSYTVDDRPSLAEAEIETAWREMDAERTLTLPQGASVSITLAEGTKGDVTLAAGEKAVQTQPDKEDKITPLPEAMEAQVDFPTDATATLPLPPRTKVTILELPELDRQPRADLPVTEVAGAPGAMLPAGTVAITMLSEDLLVDTNVPQEVQTKVRLEDGTSGSVTVGKGAPTQVTLKAGDEIRITFTESTGAQADPEDLTADVLPLPTWSTCMFTLSAIAEARHRKGGDAPVSIFPACAEAGTEGKADWLAGQYTRIASWSFWDVLQRALMVFATIVATIFFREVRVDQNSWKPWSFKRIPFLRLLSMSVSPALIGVFALSSAFVIQLIWDSSFSVTQRQVTDLFQHNWVYFAWHLIPCMILSITALILMDKHDDWPVEVSVLVGAICALCLIGLSWVIYTVNSAAIGDVRIDLSWLPGEWSIARSALRDTIITATLPAIFIVLFAAFLELTEDSRGSNWLIGRAIGGPLLHLRDVAGPKMFKSLMYLLALAILATLIWTFAAVRTDAQTTAQISNKTTLATDDQSSGPHDTTETAEIILRIGVRSDARPFSYRSQGNFDVLTAATPGPLAQDKYTGFIVKICDAVLTELLANPRNPGAEVAEEGAAVDDAIRLDRDNIEIVNVDRLIARDKERSRFDYFGSEFDILCDPSTITNERRSGLILSPPLFLSGISFIDLHGLPKPRGDGCPSLPLIGLVGNTTAANSGIRAILKAKELPRYRDLLIDWLDDGENQCAKGREGYKAVRILTSHNAAAKAFCNREFHYYLGDQEIIINSARQIPGCDFDQAARTFTTDRYAIFGKIDYADADRALWVTRFFEVLSQKVPFSPSILDTAFSDTFIGTEKSRALELFFWSIRGPK